MSTPRAYDYVVAGALVEAGGPDRKHEIHIPTEAERATVMLVLIGERWLRWISRKQTCGRLRARLRLPSDSS